MKKIILYILILICLLQSGGMSLLYQLELSTLKEQARELLKTEIAPLEKFSLTLIQFQQSKIEKDEIIFNGKMYDIKSSKIIGNRIEIIAYCDHAEDQFMDKITKLFSTKKKNKLLPDPLQKLIVAVYLIPESIHQHFIIGEYTLNYLQLQEDVLINYHLIFSPPPDCA